MTSSSNHAAPTSTVPPMCGRHPLVRATVKVPRGEHTPRYLCHECFRDERPIIYVSLVSYHLPSIPSIT